MLVPLVLNLPEASQPQSN